MDEACPGFGPATLSHLRRNKTVNMELLVRICEYLECSVGEVVDYVSDDIKRKQSHQ